MLQIDLLWSNIVHTQGLSPQDFWPSAGVSTQTFNLPENMAFIGTAFPSQQVEIMDDNNILPYGEKGEICIKGDAVTLSGTGITPRLLLKP